MEILSYYPHEECQMCGAEADVTVKLFEKDKIVKLCKDCLAKQKEERYLAKYLTVYYRIESGYDEPRYWHCPVVVGEPMTAHICTVGDFTDDMFFYCRGSNWPCSVKDGTFVLGIQFNYKDFTVYKEMSREEARRFLLATPRGILVALRRI